MKQEIKRFWQNSNIWTAVLCVAALLFIVVPLTYIARYMWPVSDDFELSLWTKEAFDTTGSVWQVFKRAWDFTVYKYFSWQGAYSSILLMALQPGVWGDQYYGLGLVVIMVSLLAGIFGLSYVIMVKYGRAPKSVWLTITSLVSFAWFLRVMYTEEAFYWWTGASYYTGFYAWGMMMVTVMLLFYNDWKQYGWLQKSFFYIIGVFACLFVAGGNFPTTLLLILVGCGLTTAAYVSKKKSRFVLLTYTITTIAGLLASILAPGNAKHMSNDMETNISALEAIFISIRDGLGYIESWINVSVIMLFVFLLPFVWQLARKCTWKFKWPVVATILSGGLYLAEYAPVSYAFGGYAPGRMINLYYINFYWLLLFNVCYWVGWIYRRLEEKKPELLEKVSALQVKWQSCYVCVAGVLFLLSVVRVGITNTNLYWVYSEWYHGYYQQVDEFITDRVAYFEEHQGEDVVVEKVPYESVITYFGDLFPDKNHLVNETMAEYYGVNSISLKEE